MFGHDHLPTIGSVDRRPKRDIIVRRNYRAALRISSWARSATKHRISHERASYVIENCEIYFEFEDPDGREPRLLFLGDDAAGKALEVIAVRLEGLRVIHAMHLRARHRQGYERAMRWQAGRKRKS